MISIFEITVIFLFTIYILPRILKMWNKTKLDETI